MKALMPILLALILLAALPADGEGAEKKFQDPVTFDIR